MRRLVSVRMPSSSTFGARVHSLGNTYNLMSIIVLDILALLPILSHRKQNREKMPGLPAAPEFCNGDFTNPRHGKAPAQAPEYEYEPLPDDQYIRMLTLDPGKPDDPLQGKLEFVHIASSGTYEPLSYVWGEAKRCHQITIRNDKGDGRLKLTDSLHGALRQIRHTDQERRLWADQICINQEDMEERSQQVQFMNMIYKNASEVLVWLGPADQGIAESAFKLVDELDAIFQDEAKFKKFHIDHTENLKEQSRDRWNPLDHLTALPWVSRAAAILILYRHPMPSLTFTFPTLVHPLLDSSRDRD
jgi:hypothetical protein